MGKPMPGWDVQILDEDERPVAQGERGEICLRARTNNGDRRRAFTLGNWLSQAVFDPNERIGRLDQPGVRNSLDTDIAGSVHDGCAHTQ